MKVGPYWDDWVHPAGNSSDSASHDEDLAEEEEDDETRPAWIPVDWETQTVYVTEDGEQESEPEEGAYVEIERILWAEYRLEGSSRTAIYEYGQFWDAEVNR